MIFISACFGVILEGPMGAAVFWTLLGLANSAGDHSNEHAETNLLRPNLQVTSERDEVPVSVSQTS